MNCSPASDRMFQIIAQSKCKVDRERAEKGMTKSDKRGCLMRGSS